MTEVKAIEEIFPEPLDEELCADDMEEGSVPLELPDTGEEIFAEPVDEDHGYIEQDDVEPDDEDYDEDGRLLLRGPLPSHPRPEPTRLHPEGDRTPPPRRIPETWPMLQRSTAPRTVPRPPPVRRT